MKQLLIAMSVLGLTCVCVYSQAPYRLYTSPRLPARDVLARMNLVMAWNTRVKVDGGRDGVFSVQVLPGVPNQVVAQTYAGAVYLFDADSGDLIWKTRVGIPYWTPQPAGFNSQSIFVTRRNVLHVLNRFNGTQRVFTFNDATKETTFGYDMDYAPSAAPVADEELLHVSMGDWLQAFYIPDFEGLERLKRAGKQGKKDVLKDAKTPYADEEPSMNSPPMIYYWGHRLAPQTTEFPPVVYGDRISVLTTAGELLRFNRFEKGPRVEFLPFKMGGRAAAGAGQYYPIAYVGSDDYNLYALDLNNGRLLWRYVSGAPIAQKPEVNDREIYVAPERVGLQQIDRVSGRHLWTNRDTNRFLAANDKNVYALDRVGRFYVLDALRGSTLAKLDLADWAIPVANEWTDRIYLAANDGQIMCLRHRDLAKAMVMKSPETVKKKEEKKPMEEKKDDAMKDDEKKDEKKEDKKEEKKDDAKKDADKMGRLLLPRADYSRAQALPGNALPRGSASQPAVASMAWSRQSLQDAAFPGRAWERGREVWATLDDRRARAGR